MVVCVCPSCEFERTDLFRGDAGRGFVLRRLLERARRRVGVGGDDDDGSGDLQGAALTSAAAAHVWWWL